MYIHKTKIKLSFWFAYVKFGFCEVEHPKGKQFHNYSALSLIILKMNVKYYIKKVYFLRQFRQRNFNMSKKTFLWTKIFVLEHFKKDFLLPCKLFYFMIDLYSIFSVSDFDLILNDWITITFLKHTNEMWKGYINFIA